MRILLTNPPWIVKGKKGVRAGSRWPHLKAPEEEGYLPFPFFLAYANTLLKKNGFKTKIIDSIAEDDTYEEFYDKAAGYSPDLIVIEISAPSLNNDLEAIRQLKKMTGAMIAVGGMALIDEKLLEENKEIDFGLIGEYEFTLLELAQKLGKRDLEGIKGLLFRKNDEVIRSQKRPLCRNLDELPWPYSDELPMKRYHDCPGGIPAPSAQIWSSRGCPFSCTFCAWPQMMYETGKYRTRSVKDIVDEILFLKKKGFKSFYFDDDTFNIGKKRVLEICEMLQKQKVNLPWAIMARADLVDEEILIAMKNAGLHALKYGVESSSQKLLDACNKKLDIEKAEKNIELTKKVGIKVHLTFTFGLPGETKKTIKDTIKFALRMDPESVQFSITTPFPGTKYHSELKKRGELVAGEEFDGNYKAMIKNDNLSPQDLEEAVRAAYRRWLEHKEKREMYREKSPTTLFKECLQEHGIVYTIKKTARYVAGKKYLLYLRKKEVNDGEKVLIGPEYVTIDMTNRCNFNCIGCWTFSPMLKKHKPKKDWFKQELAFEKIKQLVEELSEMGTKEIRLTGGGEPMLHKSLIETVRLIKSKCMKCDITTNLSLATKEKIAALVDAGIDNVTVSMWAGDAETYAKIHPNQGKNTFEKIKENLKLLKNKRESIKLVIANVIMNNNYRTVDEMMRFAEEVEADEVYFTFIDPVYGETDNLLLNEKQRKELLAKLERMKKEKHKIQIDNIENLIRRLSGKEAERGHYDSNMLPGMKCYAGHVFSRIMANGDVAPCCRAVNSIVGNINEKSFNYIWNGRLQKEFRKEGLIMSKEFTCKIGCYKTCDNWWENKRYNSQMILPK